MRNDQVDARTEEALGKLASDSGFQSDVHSQLDSLASEANTSPTAQPDPVNAAFDAVNKSAEKQFADSLAAGVNQPAAVPRILQREDVQASVRADATKKDALAPVGGSELVNAFRNQEPAGGNPGNALDVQTFAQRVRAVGLMAQIDPSSVKNLVDYRATLSPEDRLTFDEGHFGLFDSNLQSTIASLANNGPVLGANPIANLSPKQLELENKYRDKAGLPPLGSDSSTDPYADAVKNLDANSFNDYLTQKAQMTGSPQDAQTLATYRRISRLDARDAWDSQRQTVIGPLSEAMAKAIADNPVTADVIAPLSSAAGGPDQASIHKAVDETTKSILTGFTSGDRVNVVTLPVFTLLPFSEASGIVERIAFNGLVGGLTGTAYAGGSEENQGQILTFRQAAKDFAIGAFAGATLPELGHALGALKDGVYSRKVVKAILEDDGAKSTALNSVASDGHVQVLDAPPEIPTIDGLTVKGHDLIGTDPTERLNISPLNADEVGGAVETMVADRLTAEKALANADRAQTMYDSETAIREAAANLPEGKQTGFAREVQNRAKSLTAESQVAAARQAAADAVERLNASVARATEAGSRAASDTASETIDNAIRATETTQRFYHGTTAEGASGILADKNIRPTKAATGTMPGVYLHETADTAAISARTSARLANTTETVLPVDVSSSANIAPRGIVDSVKNELGLGDTPAEMQRLADELRARGYDGADISAKFGSVEQNRVVLFDSSAVKLPAIGGGADVGGVRALLQQTYDDGIEMASRLNDPYNGLVASTIARIHSTLTGVFPGAMGVFARAREDLARALDVWTRDALGSAAKEANKLVKAERDGLQYIGPESSREFATAYPDLALEQHPEWYRGSTLSRLHNQVQAIFDQKVKLLQEWGYPIKQLDGIFLPQMWEIDQKATLRGIKGVVSTAKNRVFVDYEHGVAAGLTPKALTVGERWIMHDNALNQAMADAMFKRMLEQRGLLKKGVANAVNGKFEANSGLFRGFVGDKSTAEAIDTLFRPSGAIERNTRAVSARIKTTLLGLSGPVAVGTHFLTALMHGDVTIALSQVEKFVNLMHLPGALNYEELAPLGDRVFAANAGVQLGQRSVDLAPRSGTVLGLLPFKTPDRVATKLADGMGHAVFSTLSDPFRVEMFKGMLFLQHVLGRDVADPEVQKAAADFVNRSFLSSTGAQSPLRSTIENTGFLSARTTRGELANLAAIGDVFRVGALNDARRITAIAGLATLAAHVYGIQYAAYQAFGGPKPNWNPTDQSTWKDFGTLHVGGRTIRFVKEKGLIDAMQRSFVALKNQDPSTVADVWQRFYAGKAGPLPSDVLTLLGHGYNAQGFYQSGNLPAADRLSGLIPFPIVVQDIARNGVSAFDPVGMALESFGMNNYADSISVQRNDWLRDPSHNPYKPSDPRYQAVLQHGYSGLEKAEKVQFKQDHPEFFAGTRMYPNADAKAVAEQVTALQQNLWDLDAQVATDPLKRRDYKDARSTILTKLAALYAANPTAAGATTVQDKAQNIYFGALDTAAKAIPGGNLTGDAFGTAEADARNQVFAKFGQEGLDALDRALSAGQTPLDTEYRQARKTISDSGYYNLSDSAIKAAGLPFKDYNDWLSELNAYAKEKGVDPTQLPAYTQMQSAISKAKISFRVDHPEVDAMLVVWDGATPQSKQAADIASQILQTTIQQSKSSQKSKPSLQQIVSALK